MCATAGEKHLPLKRISNENDADIARDSDGFMPRLRVFCQSLVKTSEYVELDRKTTSDSDQSIWKRGTDAQ